MGYPILPAMPLMMPEDAKEEVEQVHEAVDRASENGSFQVLITGEATLDAELATLDAELKETAEKDLQTGEGIGISVALVVLALVFGAIVAALLPIVLAIAAIIVALGATALVGQAFDLSFFVTNMITMMGLAVGIDYVASDTMTKKGLGKLLVDQAAYKMPFKLYRRLGMARITAPRLPQQAARRTADSVFPHETFAQTVPAHAGD